MFYDNICKICNDRGVSPTVILRELGLSTGNISQWKQGSVPNINIALAIAQKLNVSLDYLVTLEGEDMDKSFLHTNTITRKQFHFENDEERLEIERLIACYQIASRDDKNVVWAALNKYAPKIDKIAP